MSSGHDHGAGTANERNLWIVLGLTAPFMAAEVAKVHVEFMDPNAVLDLVGKPEIRQLAAEVRQRLERVLQAF